MPTSRRIPPTCRCDSSWSCSYCMPTSMAAQSRCCMASRPATNCAKALPAPPLGRGPPRRAASLHPCPRDIGAVARKGGRCIDQQRLRGRGALRVAHVVQRRRVLAQRDDVLVRRVHVVLAGGTQEGEVQLQLATLAALEEPPQLLVPERGA